MVSTEKSVIFESCCSDETLEGVKFNQCPMAAKCGAIISNPKLPLNLRITGVVLLVLGVAIVLEPMILAWLVACLIILLGIAVLILSHFVNRFIESSVS